MIKIALFCNAGMSTSMLVQKMREEAKKRNLEAQIDAFPEAAMAKQVEGLHAALLGPQIKHALGKAQQICDAKGVAVEVINIADYGMMNGAKVLDQALRLAQKNKC